MASSPALAPGDAVAFYAIDGLQRYAIVTNPPTMDGAAIDAVDVNVSGRSTTDAFRGLFFGVPWHDDPDDAPANELVFATWQP